MTDRAIGACVPRIEAEAPGDFDWVYRPNAAVFQEATPPDSGSTVIRYRGDSIRFLNAQEKWIRVMYECGFDASKAEVVSVRVRPGVLGKPSAVPVVPAPKPQARAPQPSLNPVASGPARPTTPATASATAPTVDRRRVGEPNDVSVLQIKAPPAAR